ncbi:MAG: hypothetical protein ACE5KM_07880 [Planctomycetaceae bacterium]
MRRLFLYCSGVAMIAGGLVIGCAQDRCGSGRCGTTGGRFTPPPAGPAMPQGSGAVGSPSYRNPMEGAYGGPAPGPGNPGGSFGGSGSR